MAAKYRKVSVFIWNDEKFRAFTDDGKLAFLFILTHPHMTSVGAMRATVSGLASELGWTTERLSEAFRKGICDGMIIVDSSAFCVALPHFLKHNPPESPNVIKSWASSLDLIPEGCAKNIVIQRLIDFGNNLSGEFKKAFGSLSEAFRKGMPYQEQEQEQELSTANAVEVSGAAGDVTPNCPHEKIVALYHELLPSNPRVVEWNGARQDYLRTRWRERSKPGKTSEGYETEEAGIAWWRKFLGWVGQSKFLTGQTDGRDGKPPFLADLEWIVRPRNFVKIIEGKYHRG